MISKKTIFKKDEKSFSEMRILRLFKVPLYTLSKASSKRSTHAVQSSVNVNHEHNQYKKAPQASQPLYIDNILIYNDNLALFILN
ncbi:hypothetical protein [Bartonella raoultii]|uniref:hypothetical protein n=1 Tax=Bartonella raoultii TaxID=1457020 RepID=UPI001ABAD544|nr:hypothetical protein [Bartonella raoultii]